MSGVKGYEDATRRNGVDAVHIAMRTLREHWDSVEIDVTRVDGEGNVQSYALHFDPDEEDEDDEALV